MSKAIHIDYGDYKAGIPCKFKKTCAKIHVLQLEDLMDQYRVLLDDLEKNGQGSPAERAMTCAFLMGPMKWLEAYIEKRKKRLGHGGAS